MNVLSIREASSVPGFFTLLLLSWSNHRVALWTCVVEQAGDADSSGRLLCGIRIQDEGYVRAG